MCKCVYTLEPNFFIKIVDIRFSAHDSFPEYPLPRTNVLRSN